jgi:hypothetical protein
MEEFERVAALVDGHNIYCICDGCKKFMELAELIRAQRAEQKAGATK